MRTPSLILPVGLADFVIETKVRVDFFTGQQTIVMNCDRAGAGSVEWAKLLAGLKKDRAKRARPGLTGRKCPIR